MTNTVKFSNPPVVEVACGILFSNADLLKTVHIGEFWNVIKSDFPIVEDAPPLDPVVEMSGDLSQINQQVLTFATLPPLRRVWFISNDGRNLLQVQSDRFLFNWKRTQADDEYPSYEKVMEKFEHWLNKFESFCKDAKLPKIEYRQFELVYVNHITNSNGLEKVKTDAIFVDHTRDKSRERFLPSPTLINWSSSYNLPKDYGRLHISMQSAYTQAPKKENLLRLDLTARGIPTQVDDSSRKEWFEMAHEWITKGFADSTNTELHLNNCWGRTL